jgi:hypothetical protein
MSNYGTGRVVNTWGSFTEGASLPYLVPVVQTIGQLDVSADVVIVAVPTSLHQEIYDRARKTYPSAKILLEKPAGFPIRDMSSTVVGYEWIHHNQRPNPEDIVGIHFYHGYPPENSPVLFDLGCHCLSLLPEGKLYGPVTTHFVNYNHAHFDVSGVEVYVTYDPRQPRVTRYVHPFDPKYEIVAFLSNGGSVSLGWQADLFERQLSNLSGNGIQSNLIESTLSEVATWTI